MLSKVTERFEWRLAVYCGERFGPDTGSIRRTKKTPSQFSRRTLPYPSYYQVFPCRYTILYGNPNDSCFPLGLWCQLALVAVGVRVTSEMVAVLLVASDGTPRPIIHSPEYINILPALIVQSFHINCQRRQPLCRGTSCCVPTLLQR